MQWHWGVGAKITRSGSHKSDDRLKINFSFPKKQKCSIFGSPSKFVQFCTPALWGVSIRVRLGAETIFATQNRLMFTQSIYCSARSVLRLPLRPTCANPTPPGGRTQGEQATPPKALSDGKTESSKEGTKSGSSVPMRRSDGASTTLTDDEQSLGH